MRARALTYKVRGQQQRQPTGCMCRCACVIACVDKHLSQMNVRIIIRKSNKMLEMTSNLFGPALFGKDGARVGHHDAMHKRICLCIQ